MSEARLADHDPSRRAAPDDEAALADLRRLAARPLPPPIAFGSGMDPFTESRRSGPVWTENIHFGWALGAFLGCFTVLASTIALLGQELGVPDDVLEIVVIPLAALLLLACRSHRISWRRARIGTDGILLTDASPLHGLRHHEIPITAFAAVVLRREAGRLRDRPSPLLRWQTSTWLVHRDARLSILVWQQEASHGASVRAASLSARLGLPFVDADSLGMPVRPPWLAKATLAALPDRLWSPMQPDETEQAPESSAGTEPSPGQVSVPGNGPAAPTDPRLPRWLRTEIVQVGRMDLTTQAPRVRPPRDLPDRLFVLQGDRRYAWLRPEVVAPDVTAIAVLPVGFLFLQFGRRTIIECGPDLYCYGSMLSVLESEDDVARGMASLIRDLATRGAPI